MGGLLQREGEKAQKKGNIGWINGYDVTVCRLRAVRWFLYWKTKFTHWPTLFNGNVDNTRNSLFNVAGQSVLFIRPFQLK